MMCVGAQAHKCSRDQKRCLSRRSLSCTRAARPPTGPFATGCLGNRQDRDKIGTNFRAVRGIAPPRIAAPAMTSPHAKPKGRRPTGFPSTNVVSIGPCSPLAKGRPMVGEQIRVCGVGPGQVACKTTRVQGRGGPGARCSRNDASDGGDSSSPFGGIRCSQPRQVDRPHPRARTLVVAHGVEQ